MKILIVGEHGLTGFGRVIQSLGTEFVAAGHEVHQVVTGGYDNASWKTYVPPEEERDIKFAPFACKVADAIKPDVVLILQDIWYLKLYHFNFPTYAYVCVDGDNVRRDFVAPLNSHITPIFYNNFGYGQCTLSGFYGVKHIVPHGVSDSFYPEDKKECRLKLKIPGNSFVIGNINANQVRKRLDITIASVAKFIHNSPEMDIRLLFHHYNSDVSIGWDLPQLCEYYGIRDKLITTGAEGKHLSDSSMRTIYSALDLQVSTSSAEGWGLTTLEGMACGVPQIVPNFSGVAEWSRGCAVQAGTLDEPYVLTGAVNTVGRVVSTSSMHNCLMDMWASQARSEYSAKGLELSKKLTWKQSAELMLSILKSH